MKVNLELLKLVIRLIILLILFVVLFLISAFLYSARYWPDIYNYVNANITIKRIPTLSELNLTIIEVDYVTETYSTTDFDYSDSTNGYDATEDSFSFDDFDFPKSKVRRNAELEQMRGNDYSEVPTKAVLVDYFFMDEGSSKVVKNLVDESKWTTRGDVEIVMGEPGMEGVRSMSVQPSTLGGTIFPWIAAIFLKNESKGSQFDYFCDGVVLNERAVLTAARCVHNGSQTFSEEDFIVIFGKTSLQVSGGNEQVLRVKSVKPHENFTIDDGSNDLAILILEEPLSFSEGIKPAILVGENQLEDDGDIVTTAWDLRGDLTLVYFDKAKSKACRTDNKVENTFCATYGDAIALCPSYGGLYVQTRGDSTHVTGIRTGNPLERGICFSKDVNYTSIQNYTQWILEACDNKDV